MRAVIQRAARAAVTVEGQIVGQIDRGLIVLLGVHRDDLSRDASYLAEKIVALRLFDDAQGRMSASLADIGGGLLIVSQFTLYGDVRRGRRPSWSEAAPPEVAEPLYELFVQECRRLYEPGLVATGRFRQPMLIELVNDGPVTIILESRQSF